ncbi:MAG: NAD(P)/FAD-dependent oxidoreductase [Pseudomonadota bacterium]
MLNDLAVEAREALRGLAAALAGDGGAAAALFEPGGYWRDLVAFSWNLATFEGREAIVAMLSAQLVGVAPRNFALSEGVTAEGDVISAWFTFETGVARCTGHMRLRGGKIFTLLTAMDALTAHHDLTGEGRPLGAKHGQSKAAPNWKERRDAQAAALGRTTQPFVVVIGGGQGGIALGARLKAHGVPAVIVEKNARAGDSWRNRYKSLCLHDPVWYDHLPYLDFPKTWPVFAPKDKLGDFLEMYVSVMELDYWTGSTVTSAAYDEMAGRWTVRVDRAGEMLTLLPAHIVFATGMSGKPHVPDLPGAATFAGDLHHSSAHPGPEGFVGKRVVVIGSNNSAHDICQALWEHDVDVTMVQRSPTHVVRSDSLMELGLGPLYSEEAVARGMTTEKADMIFASVPYGIMHHDQIALHNAIRARDADFYARLAAAGFMLDWGEDESGIQMKYLRRGSGYYIDIGASELIISGHIKLAKGGVARIEANAVVLESGERLPADVIVLATGYGSMNGFVADLVSPQVADKVGKVWGLGSGTTKDPGPWEGEPRNMWKPTAQAGLWFHGGNLHQSRHYSLYLALQLKARMEGLPTPVYGQPAVHHTS